MKTFTISRNLKYILVGAMSLSLIVVFAAPLTSPTTQPLNYIAPTRMYFKLREMVKVFTLLSVYHLRKTAWS